MEDYENYIKRLTRIKVETAGDRLALDLARNILFAALPKSTEEDWEDCLELAGGDVAKAQVWRRERLLARAAGYASRDAKFAELERQLEVSQKLNREYFEESQKRNFDIRVEVEKRFDEKCSEVKRLVKDLADELELYDDY